MDDDKGVGGAVEKGFSTDLVTDKAIRWIKERDRTKPFSVFCHFKATHEPCDFPERFAHLYDGVRFPEPENLLEFGPAKSGRTFAGQPLETMAWRWNKAYTDPENWWTYYPELPFCGVEGDSVANRRAIYQKARPRLPALRRGDRRQHRPSAPHARRRGTGGKYGRDLRLGSGIFPRRARLLRQADHVRGTAAHALRDPLPEGDSGRNPQRGHRHQRRFRFAAGRLCRSRTAAAGAGPQFPQQPRGRHAAGVAPQHVLPLLDPARNTPGAHGHPQRPLQA